MFVEVIHCGSDFNGRSKSFREELYAHLLVGLSAGTLCLFRLVTPGSDSLAQSLIQAVKDEKETVCSTGLSNSTNSRGTDPPQVEDVFVTHGRQEMRFHQYILCANQHLLG